MPNNEQLAHNFQEKFGRVPESLKPVKEEHQTDSPEDKKAAQVAEAQDTIQRLTADLARKDDQLFELMSQIEDPNLDDGAREILRKAHQTALEQFGKETLQLIQQRDGKERLIQLLTRTADDQPEGPAERTQIIDRLNQGTRKFDVGDLRKELAEPPQEEVPPLYDGPLVELPNESQDAVTPIENLSKQNEVGGTANEAKGLAPNMQEARAATQSATPDEEDDAPSMRKRDALHIYTTPQGQVNAQRRAEIGRENMIRARRDRQEKMRKQKKAYQQQLDDAKKRKMA